MLAATVAEQEQLAKMVESDRNSLWQFGAKPDAKYKRDIKAEFAERLEAASIVMNYNTMDREGSPLPIMLREELTSVCSRCPRKKRCNEEETD